METAWKKCLKQVLKNYCNNTSLHGYKYLVQSDRPRIEKFIWFITLTTMSLLTWYIFSLMLDDYKEKITITAAENTKYNIRNVPFPAVAICNINKISRIRAAKISKEMHEKYNISEDILFGIIKDFGKLYDFEIESTEDISKLHSIIEHFNATVYSYEALMNILVKLSVPCEETLVKCMWLGQRIDCSKLFRTRRTMDGYCCTFNYVKTWKNGDGLETLDEYTNEEVYFAGAGIDLGLTVVVRSQPDDYYYPSTSTEGFSVKVFNAHDYPDINSGGMVESFIPLQHEAFLQVTAITIRAAPELHDLPAHKRRCVFENEGKTVFDTTFYSYSDCLSDCKLKSILALCECVPFFLSVLKSYAFSKQVCTLTDVTCLNKHKEKWMNIFPVIDAEELDSERENSIFCPHCLPSCSFTAYSVDTNYASLALVNNNLAKDINITEHNIIHIYSDTEDTLLYESDVNYYWFDIISNFGGMWSLFLGFSLISILEFVYFITIRYYRLLNNK